MDGPQAARLQALATREAALDEGRDRFDGYRTAFGSLLLVFEEATE